MNAEAIDDDDLPVSGRRGFIPVLGDPASRRLPSRVLFPWDEWLRQALDGMRSVLGKASRQTRPPWRILLMPGACECAGCAGMLISGVDRVGRYPPLRIAVELSPMPTRETGMESLSNRLDQTEDAARAAARRTLRWSHERDGSQRCSCAARACRGPTTSPCC